MNSNKQIRNLIYQHRAYKKYEQPLYCWDIKGWLIFYNMLLDRLTAEVQSLVKISSCINSQHEQMTLEECVLLLEDRYYYTHSGIDYRFIPRVIRQLVSGRRIGGVSTIEQQYVRTFLNRKERTIGRKFNEWVMAWLLSHRSSKADILSAYLSCAYFGYKLNGCEPVSDKIFSKKASSLTSTEAAFIASLLVYPLPKKIIEYQKSPHLLPVIDIDTFLDQAELITPLWAKNVRHRWMYALNLIDKTK